MRTFKEFMVLLFSYFAFILIGFQWVLDLREMKVQLEPETQLILAGIGASWLLFAFILSVKRVPAGYAVIRLASFSEKVFLPGTDRFYLLLYAVHGETRLPLAPQKICIHLKAGKTADNKDIDCQCCLIISVEKTKESALKAGEFLRASGTEAGSLTASVQDLLQDKLAPELIKLLSPLTMSRIISERDRLLAIAEVSVANALKERGLVVENAIIRFNINDAYLGDAVDV